MAFPANIPLSTLNGGDGFDDIIVGSTGSGIHRTVSGESFVVFGKASGFAANIELSSLGGSTGFTLNGGT